MLVFATSRSNMEAVLLARVGQAIMTSATSACYDGLGGDERLKVGGKLRYFGDGFQRSKLLDGRRLWRVPVMDGEFVVEESFGVAKGVGGGNFFMMAEDLEAALAAARGGGRRDALRARRDHAVSRRSGALRQQDLVPLQGPERVEQHAVLPDAARPGADGAARGRERRPRDRRSTGWTSRRCARPCGSASRAACLPGVTRISAGNYGGSLGQFHFALRELVTA